MPNAKISTTNEHPRAETHEHLDFPPTMSVLAEHDPAADMGLVLLVTEKTDADCITIIHYL